VHERDTANCIVVCENASCCRLTKQTQIDDENGAVLVLAEVVVVVVVLVVAGS